MDGDIKTAGHPNGRGGGGQPKTTPVKEKKPKEKADTSWRAQTDEGKPQDAPFSEATASKSEANKNYGPVNEKKPREKAGTSWRSPTGEGKPKDAPFSEAGKRKRKSDASLSTSHDMVVKKRKVVPKSCTVRANEANASNLGLYLYGLNKGLLRNTVIHVVCWFQVK